MTTLKDIANQRLVNQQLVGEKFKSPREVVAHMGAIQAQDYHMAKWAIGARMQNATDPLVEEAINKGEIIRTHVMRPTWHFVTAEDIRWMVNLTAPHVKSSLKSYEAKMGLTKNFYKRTNAVIEKMLLGNNYQTRSEIVAELKKKKITVDNLQASFVMFNAELNGIVCNGPMRGKQFTYALMDERIATTKALTTEEALTKLSLNYFISHGPATIQDFAWWSGLPMATARQGLELVKEKLACEKVENKVYWFKGTLTLNPFLKDENSLFLPAYDEFMISYTDRSASLDPKFSKITMVGNGIFRPIIVVDGKIIGIWTRVIKKNHIEVNPQFFYPKEKLKKKEMESLMMPYGKFLNLNVAIKQ